MGVAINARLQYRGQHCWEILILYTHHFLLMLMRSTSLKVALCMITMASYCYIIVEKLILNKLGLSSDRQ